MKILTPKTIMAVAFCIALLQAIAQSAPSAVADSIQYGEKHNGAAVAGSDPTGVFPGENGSRGQRSEVESERSRFFNRPDEVMTLTGTDDSRLLQMFHGHPGISGGPGNDAGPLIIRTSKPDPKNESLEEDLVVMRRILEKAILPGSGDKAQGRAMGIPLVALGISRKPGSIYLQGYGALFIFETDMPLLPATEKKQNEKSKERNSTWEETKQEIYGGEAQFRMSPKFQMGDEPGEPYDAAKVEELKSSILKALVDASNIRGLSDERVVVVVSNRSRHESRDRFRVMAFANADAGRTSTRYDSEPKHVYSAKARSANGPEKNEGKMTISVKKSDIELLAKKGIDFEEFKKKAEITIY